MEDDRTRVTSYDLFIRIAKSLALKLPHTKDRVLAAKWIRKIDNMMDLDFPQKSKYLKLINISMQSQVLVGPFTTPPPMDDFDIQALYHLKPVDIQNMVTDKHRGAMFKDNPYHAVVSDDLKEYVVIQEIPEFGTHFYYACSLEPITEWRHRKFTIVPKGALESIVMKPPLPNISASKEEFLNNYNEYVKQFNNQQGCDDCPEEIQEECEPEFESECVPICPPQLPPKRLCNGPQRRHCSNHRKMRTVC